MKNYFQGTVTSRSEEPIVGALIYRKGEVVAKTDDCGEFNFESKKSKLKVIVSAALYKDKKIKLDSDESEYIKLKGAYPKKEMPFRLVMHCAEQGKEKLQEAIDITNVVIERTSNLINQ